MSLTSGTRFIGISENVNLKERKSAVINAETQPFTAQDIANFIGPGATGPQGVQGPAGPLGPVGPAGLTWRGAWVSGTSYIANDAVGYNGASYFCILATSGTSNPTVATTNWALLASQGAQGIQGVQGPTGPQGAGATQTLQQTVALGNTIDQGEGTVLSIASSELKIQDSLGGRLWLEYTSGSKPNIQFGIPNSGGLRTDLQTPDVQTASRTIKLPDASGTIALTSQLPVPPYKSYVALLEFVNSTTIIPTVIYNTIGNGSGDGINDIAWSYNSSAQPKAVMSAGSPFTANKTVCVNSTYAQGNVIYNLSGYRNSNNQVRFYSVQISNSTASIAFVPFVYVEIRVYN